MIKIWRYYEAYSQSWDKLDDVRLSDRDLNLPKGMNTNLHVLEAYTTLFEATKSPQVEKALRALIDVYSQKIIDKHNHIVIFLPKIGHRKLMNIRLDMI